MSTDEEHYIGYTMTDVARLLRTVFERRVRSLGLTRAQWVTIARLHRRPGLSQSEVADLLEIEKASFEFPWSEEDFIRCLRQRNCIGMVAEHGERVGGRDVDHCRGPFRRRRTCRSRRCPTPAGS